MDSGATEHQIYDEKVFASSRVLKSPVIMNVAKDKETMKAVRTGNIQATSKVGETITKLNIKNVLYIPEVRRNLLSIDRMVKAGLEVKFQNERKAIIRNRGDTIGVAWNRDGLYEWKMRLQAANRYNTSQ